MFKRLSLIGIAFVAFAGTAGAQSYYGGNLVNRAEMAKLALENAGVSPGGSNCFSDVHNEWFAPYVCAAKNQGIVTGYPDGRFKPANTVSFVEAAAIALRAEGFRPGSDNPWYRPYLEELADFDAVPRSIANIFHPVNRAQVDEMLAGIEDGDDQDDDDDDDDNDTDIKISVEDDDDPVDEEDTITYTIEIENNGDDDDSIDVTAFLDEDMTYVSSTKDGDLEDGDEVQWDNIDIDEDDSVTLKLKVRLKSRADDGDTVKLRVEAGDDEATETTEIDDDSDDDDDDDSDEDIDVSVTDSSDEVEPGEEFEYRIRIENNGDDDERVDVVAFLDEDTTFVSASDDGDKSGHEVEWDDMLVREDATLTLTVRVRVDNSADDGDTLNFRVEVDDEEDSEDTDVEDEDDDDDDDNGEDVTVSVSGTPGTAEIGEIVTYRITLKNDDNNDATVDLRATLDDGMSYVSSTDGGDLEGDDEVTWENLDINDDDEKVVTLRVRINNKADDGDTLVLVVETDDDEDVEETDIED